MDRQATLTNEAKQLILELGKARDEATDAGDHDRSFRLTRLESIATARWLRRYRAYQDQVDANEAEQDYINFVRLLVRATQEAEENEP